MIFFFNAIGLLTFFLISLSVNDGSNHLLVVCSKENIMKSNLPGVFEKYATQKFVLSEKVSKFVQAKLNQHDKIEKGIQCASIIDDDG